MREILRRRRQVAILLDGRPGHEKQSRGIIRAMQDMMELDVLPIPVKRQNPLSMLFSTIFLFLPGKRLFFQHLPAVAGCDLLLGVGTNTHLPLLSLKKHFGIPAVICMKPPLHLRRCFDLCCVPEHDGIPGGGNIMLTTGAPNCSINRKRHEKNRGLILLGGIDERSHHWDSERVHAMVERIVKTERGMQWTVSSSPRTPPDTVQMLDRFVKEVDNAVLFRFQDTKPGWIEEQYDISSKVWVTADSISMMYEALTAGCNVGILPVEWKRTDSKFKKNEDLLLKKNLVVSYPAWIKGGCGWPAEVDLNEAQRCARLIIRKWFPNSLR